MTAAVKHTQKVAKKHAHKRVHDSVKRHYYKRMPNKRRHRILIWSVFFVVGGVIAMQLLYPPHRMMPFATVGSVQVGLATESEVAFTLHEQFKSMKVRLVVRGDEEGAATAANLTQIGGEIDTSRVIAQLSDYPFGWRFVPFSILFYHHEVTQPSITYNQIQLEAFAQRASEQFAVEPKNARLAIEDGGLVATSDVAGRTVSAESIIEAIARQDYTLASTSEVAVAAVERPADTTAGDLAQVRHEAELVLARPVQIMVQGQEIEPSAAQRADWVELVQNDNETIALRFDRGALRQYLESLNKDVGYSAGVTTVYLTDSEQTRVSRGAPGRAIDYEPLMDQIEAWMMRVEGTPVATAEFRTLTPSQRYERSYSPSQKGLQAYVTDAGRAQNATIVVQQTNGNGWAAQTGANKSMPSASTYKLYIAWILFTKMDQGQVSWSDSMRDTTVSGCFDRMVIVSANACAEQWIREFGRTAINSFLHERGYSQGTSFTHPVATHTTAGDLAKFMAGLDKGELVRDVQRFRLLRALSSHQFIQGVPAGSAGQVWNKVGFLWDYVHDAAIVHHPKGNYVIIVMTKGRSYATIAQITRQVEQIMYN